MQDGEAGHLQPFILQCLPGKFVIHGVCTEQGQEAISQREYHISNGHACLFAEAVTVSHRLRFQLGNQTKGGLTIPTGKEAVKQGVDKAIGEHPPGIAGCIQQKYAVKV